MTTPRCLVHDWFPRPLPANIVIGERSWLHSAYAFLHYRSARRCGLRIGHDTGIYDGSLFDLGPDGEVQVGDFCTLVGPIITTNGQVSIGNYSGRWRCRRRRCAPIRDCRRQSRSGDWVSLFNERQVLGK